MQFIAQVRLRDAGIRDGLLLLFECQNDPGLCEEWDPNSGGNCAMLVPLAPLALLNPPPGPTLLDGMDGVRLFRFDDPETYSEAAARFHRKDVLGQAGGHPEWVQFDETPFCCGQSMQLVVQLECNGGGGINFGDAGTGYAFFCLACGKNARFLWQCG
jgi:hypothetical protein